LTPGAALSPKPRHPSARKATTKILVIQLVITCLAASVCLVVPNLKAAYSAVIGGGISIIVTLYFAVQVFSSNNDYSAGKIARSFYAGEAIKIVLTAVLFGIAIVWLNVAFLPLFLTYAATLTAYWLVLPFTLETAVKTS
jgi:ATP synthase protein I